MALSANRFFVQQDAQGGCDWEKMAFFQQQKSWCYRWTWVHKQQIRRFHEHQSFDMGYWLYDSMNFIIFTHSMVDIQIPSMVHWGDLFTAGAPGRSLSWLLRQLGFLVILCDYPLVMTNSLPWYRWPIEIDGWPFLKMDGFSMANCECHNQMV